jgi:chemotaxis protein MotA
MLSIGGIVVVLGMVFGSFILSGGAIGPIIEGLPHEAMTILGAAVGAFMVANGMDVIKGAGAGFSKILKGPKWKREDYNDLLSLLFVLMKLVKTKGVIAIEAHIEKPDESAIFQNFPKIAADHHVTVFICDYLRMVTMNFDDPHQVEDVMGKDLEKIHHEESAPAHALSVMGEGFPALGIVAAVLGIIKTMGSINQPVEILGAMIGSALVGTFLGIFLSYTVVGPLAQRLQAILDEEHQFFFVIRDMLVSHLHGNAPQISVEIGRKCVPTKMQPNFYDLENAINELPSTF